MQILSCQNPRDAKKNLTQQCDYEPSRDASAKKLDPSLERSEWPLHPSGGSCLPQQCQCKGCVNPFTAALAPSGSSTQKTQKQSSLPFDIDVTHLLPSDAEVIKDDVLGVPDDAAQEEPGHSQGKSSMRVWKPWSRAH